MPRLSLELVGIDDLADAEIAPYFHDGYGEIEVNAARRNVRGLALLPAKPKSGRWQLAVSRRGRLRVVLQSVPEDR